MLWQLGPGSGPTGGNRFDLSQYFAVQESPNLVPEPAAALLGVTALGALAGCARTRP